MALVDDEMQISEGWQRWLEAAGHIVRVFSFEDALAAGVETWTEFDRLVTDACDRREPDLRDRARKKTGVDYADAEMLLGVNVLNHWTSFEKDLPRTPVRIVTTTYAERDRSEPFKLELLLQAGAHYIIPRSRLCDPDLCVQRLLSPSDEFQAKPLSDEQRRRLGLKPEAERDLIDAWRELHGVDDPSLLYVVDGYGKETLIRRGKAERQLRSLSRGLARLLLPPETPGAKQIYEIRTILRHLFNPTALPPSAPPKFAQRPDQSKH